MTTRTNQWQAMLLAVLLAIGAGLVWGLLAGWVMMIIDNVIMRPRQVSESISVLSDGTPIIESSDRQGRPTSTTCRTLDGRQIRELPVGRRLSTLYLGWSTDTQAAFTRPSWNNRIIQFFRTRQITEAWYAVHDGNLHGRVYIWALTCPQNARLAMSGRTDSDPTLLHRTISFPSMEPAFATRVTYLIE